MVWLTVLGLLALVAVVAETVVRHRLVQLAADRTAAALHADVELQVVGRPLLLHLLRRHVPHVVVVADDLPVLEGRARLDRLRVEFDDLRLVDRARKRQVAATSARFDLRLAEDELLEMVTLPSYLGSLSIREDGLRLTTLAGVTVDADVRLEGDGLLVQMSRSVLGILPQPSFWLALPTWPYGASIEDVALHDGWLAAWGSMDPDHLLFPVVPREGRSADGA